MTSSARDVVHREQVFVHLSSSTTTASSPSSSDDQHAHVVATRWARSCRRSRPGSGVRDALGRPARPAGSVRPAEVHQRVHRGADRAAREQHVVHQDDRLAGDVERDPGFVDLGGLGLQPDVVAVERDVQDADRHVRALDLCDLGGEAPRQVIPAVRDPDQRQPSGALVSLDDLVGDARERPADVGGVQQLPTHENAPSRMHGRALRLCRIYRSLPGLAGPDLKGGARERSIAAGSGPRQSRRMARSRAWGRRLGAVPSIR